MQISGKCKIANQWQNGQINKNSFDFENKGKVGKGRLTWSDVVKGRNGEKDTFISSTKKFVCFGANIDFIEQNLGRQLEIIGNIKTEQFKGQEGVVKYDLIVVNEVKLAELKPQSKHDQSKTNGYQPQIEEDDDSIPF